MIEKLAVKLKIEEEPIPFWKLEKLCAKAMIDKVNELVDAVNALVYESDKDSDWYDGQTPAENVQKDTESRPENVQKEALTMAMEALHAIAHWGPWKDDREEYAAEAHKKISELLFKVVKMSDKLLCPFCQQELDIDPCGEMGCLNAKCKKSTFLIGTKELWQELIRTRKALDVAMDALKLIKYRNENYNRDDSPDCIDATLTLDQINEIKGGKDVS